MSRVLSSDYLREHTKGNIFLRFIEGGLVILCFFSHCNFEAPERDVRDKDEERRLRNKPQLT